MAYYTDPKVKLSRREDTDLSLKNTRRSLADKCKLDSKSGQHGRTLGACTSNYGNQLCKKQKVRRVYSVLGRQFCRCFVETDRRKGNMGETLLQLLGSHLDNVIYRMGPGLTHAEACQLVSHEAILVNGQILNVPSAQIKTGDVITIYGKLEK